MVLSREKTGTFYYICGADANHKSGGNQCKGHRVKKEYVDEDVLRLIQSHMKAVLDTEKLIREMNSASRNQTQYWRHRFGIPRIATLKKAGEM